MYAVILRVEINETDNAYFDIANRLRDLAIAKYGCSEFTSVADGNQEIAISYWENLEQIKAWKQDPEHAAAQREGRTKWYKSYKVQVMEIIREY